MKICSGFSQRDSGVHSQTPTEAGWRIWLMLLWALTAWSVVWPLQEGISQSEHYRSMLSGAGILRVNPQEEKRRVTALRRSWAATNTTNNMLTKIKKTCSVFPPSYQIWISNVNDLIFLYSSGRNHWYLGFPSFGMMANEADFTLCTVVTAFSSPWKYISYKIINNPDAADNRISNNKDHFMNTFL